MPGSPAWPETSAGRHLTPAEVSNYWTDRALDFITSRLIALAAERVALAPLLPEVHRLADRLSAADAFYVALARARGVPLLTADAALARAASGIADVQLVRAG